MPLKVILLAEQNIFYILFFGFRRKLKKNKIKKIFSREVILRMAPKKGKFKKGFKKGKYGLKTKKAVDSKQNYELKMLKKDVQKLKTMPEIKNAPFDSTKAHSMGYITSGLVSTSTAPTCLAPGRLIEDIASGTLAMDRVGDKININSWYSRMRFQVKQSQFSSAVFGYPVDVRIIIARCVTSTIPTIVTTPSYSVFATLLKYDSASANQTSAPNNDFTRFNLPINKADWQVAYDKKHRLMPLTLTSVTGLSTSTAEKWSLIGGAKSYVDVKFDMKKHIGRVMKFTTASQPDNYKQWFVFHMALPSGHDTAYETTSAGTSFIEVQTIERLKYTDS